MNRQEIDLGQNLFKLKLKRQQLFDTKKSIKDGKIITVGLKGSIKFANDDLGDDSQELTFFNIDQMLLEESNKVRKELAEAQTKYTSSSKIVKNLNSKLEKIKPLILNNQLKAVESSLEINKSKINNVERKIEELKSIFKKTPNIIKNYNNLIQEVKLAEESLRALQEARSRFQLQMAQNTSPWSTIFPLKWAKDQLNPRYLKIY